MKYIILPILFISAFHVNAQKDNVDIVAEQENWPERWFGSEQNFNMESKNVDETYNISVYLPPSYNHSKENYPVLILPDAFFGFGIAKNTADFLIFDKAIPEIIIVGIGFKGANTIDYVKKRARDFIATKVDGFSTMGGASNFYQFVADELLPKISQEYRIDSNNKAIAGFSLSGNFVAYIMLNHNEEFEKYIIGSPAYSMEMNMLDLLSQKMDDLNNQHVTVYTFIGEKESESIPSWNQFNQIIESNKDDRFRFKKNIVAEKRHMRVFPVEFPNALEWTFNTKTKE